MSHSSKANEKNFEYELEKNKMEKAAKDTTDYAKEKAHDLSDYTKEKAQDVSDYTKEKAQDLSDYTKEKVEDLKEYTKETTEYAKEKAQDLSDYTKEKAQDVSDYTKEKAQDVKDYYNKESVEDVPTETSVDEEGGILQSAKETIASAYNAVAAKISETAEVAKEKMDLYMHGDQPQVVSEDKEYTPKVDASLPPGNVSN